jgi:hypothetical protein
VFGYVGQARLVREDGGVYQVRPEHVVYKRILATDEINLDEGYLLLAAALPVEPELPTLGGPETLAPGPDLPIPHPETPPGPSPARTRIHLALTLNRQQLYQSFNAIGNLAERAGSIRMTVEAEAAQGFDPAWLRNAVLEPLEEADVKLEGEKQ